MTPNRNWFPTSLQDRAAWFQNFADRFATVAISLGFLAADVTAVTEDNEVFQFCAEQTVEVEAFARAFRAYRDTVTAGDAGGRPPAYPANPTDEPPTSVDAGIFERLDNLVGRIRLSPNYTPEIGALLGIIPVSPDRPAPADMKPVVKSTAMPGNKIAVSFKRGYSNGVVFEIKVDNAAAWSEAGRFYTSPAELVIPESPSGLPRSVQIRARYVEGNEPVGQYSQVDTISTLPSA